MSQFQARFIHGDPLIRQDYTPSGVALVSGQVVNLGGYCGICTTPNGIADGVLGSLAIAGGVFGFKKGVSVGVTFARGAIIGWDDTNDLAVAAGSGDLNVAIAIKAATNTENEVQGLVFPGMKGFGAALAVLVDNSGGAAADGTIAAVAAPTDAPATADALRDDIAAVMVPAINAAVKELATKINAIIAAIEAAGITA